MGHSQSYDLRNPETGEKNTVRGVRRVSKEHQTDGLPPTDSSDPYDHREEELRERIRREQLRKREEELETLRIKKHEGREPIIDAYRQDHTPPPVIYDEFNHYDSLKHPSPVDRDSYSKLHRRAEINEGRRVSIPTAVTRYDQVPADPSPELPRRQEVPVSNYREIPVETPDYPNRTSVFNGRLSPLPRQQEVDPHPMSRYIPPMSPRYDGETQYTRTTKKTTYTISKGVIPRYEDPVVLRKQTRVMSPHYFSTSNLHRNDELPKLSETLPASRPKSTYFYDSNQYDSRRPSSTYSKGSQLPKYHEIPTRYTKSTEIRREIMTNPSGYHTISRSSKLPKYDEVPQSTMYSRASSTTSKNSETVPRSPSLRCLHCPIHCDDVPVQKSPRSITPTPSRVRYIPIQTSPPVPKTPIHLTTRQQEVPRVPLNLTVPKSRVSRVIPVHVVSDDSRSESPASVMYSFSSKKTSSIYQPPVNREIAKPRDETPIYRTNPPPPVVREIPVVTPKPRTQVVNQGTQPMDKITMKTIPRKNVSSIQPRKLEKLYFTRDIPRVPLSQVIRYPVYSYPPSESDESDYVIIPFSKQPSPPRRESPVQVTLLQDEVPRTPLARRPIQSKPPSPKLSPPRSPAPKLYLTPIVPEVPHSPLSRYVHRYSYPPTAVSRTVVPVPPHKSSSSITPTPLYLTSKYPEVPKAPLYDHVAQPIRRTPIYRTPSNERKTPLDHYIRKPIQKENLTRYDEDLRKTPLENYIRSKSASPIPSEVTIGTTTSSPSRIHQTNYEKDLRKTPLENYVEKEARTSPVLSPKFHSTHSSRSSRSSSISIPPAVTRTITPAYRSPISLPKLHLTRRHSDIPSCPLDRFVIRSPSTPILDQHSPSSENSSRRSLDPISPNSYTRMPARLHITKRQQEVANTPLAARPSNSIYRTVSSPAVYGQVPSETSAKYESIGTQTVSGRYRKMPPKMHLTVLEPEVPRVVYRPRPVRSRSSTIISIYSIPIDDEPTHLSELHAEKRMIVGIDEIEKPENVTYVTVATSSIQNPDEALYRYPEVGRHPVYVLPAQTCYERVPLGTRNEKTQYTRKSSDGSGKILTPSQKKCNVEHCTHVEVNDEEAPVVARRRISQNTVKDKENHLSIYVDEKDMEDVVEVADSFGNRCNIETLHYDSYMPTLTLIHRPVVSFYDKLH
ncbi:Protein CBG02733 [Caenorhabditis briggsae]|uniref:Protein CBG02733 n=1 Tax=Caenorhabditis briggsae TaxID=6238 RepID=A8WTM3_CAEBR|nr:Protein CBG02733 [Caenorhabditis briggsae]CAP23835.2 Protein CBG02733 [Caenorhabditis briggsae]